MAKIAIVGAGRIGTAAAKLLFTTSDHEVILIDEDIDCLSASVSECYDFERPQHRVAFSPTLPIVTFVAGTEEEYREVFRLTTPDVILSCVPYGEFATLAKLALELNIHYVDFTEDVVSTAQLQVPATFTKTAVPQTGVAPGLVNYLGLSLFGELGEPKSLRMRVGALPIVSFSPSHYAETWSLDGVYAEYLSPVEQKENGVVTTIDPLSNYETMTVSGVTYEAFTTSGGAGLLSAYDHIPTVCYKTLRYPGHFDWIMDVLESAETPERATEELADALEGLEKTRDDLVAVVAHAVDVNGHSATASIHFYPNRDLDITAIELTTAGTGVGIIELLLNGDLPSGILTAKDIPFDKLMGTAAVQMVFDSAD